MREGAGTAGTGPAATPPGPAPTTGVVAVATGDGIGRIFRSLGVQGLIAGGQSMNPSTPSWSRRWRPSGSDEVIILPNNGNIRPVAERVNDLTAKSVWVVPTDTIAEGFAALLAYDPEADGEVNAADHGGLGPQGGARRGHPGRAGLGQPGRARSPPATGSACPGEGSRWWATRWPARPAPCSTSW